MHDICVYRGDPHTGECTEIRGDKEVSVLKQLGEAVVMTEYWSNPVNGRILFFGHCITLSGIAMCVPHMLHCAFLPL